MKKYTIVLNLHCREGEGGSYSNILQLEPPLLSSTLLILHLTTSTSLSTGGGRAVWYHSIMRPNTLRPKQACNSYIWQRGRVRHGGGVGLDWAVTFGYSHFSWGEHGGFLFEGNIWCWGLAEWKKFVDFRGSCRMCCLLPKHWGLILWNGQFKGWGAGGVCEHMLRRCWARLKLLWKMTALLQTSDSPRVH